MSTAIYLATLFLTAALMNNGRFTDKKRGSIATPKDPGKARLAEQRRLDQLKTAMTNRAIALIERDSEAIQAATHKMAKQQPAHLPVSHAYAHVIEKHFHEVTLLDAEFMRLQAERRTLWAHGCWMTEQNQSDWWARDVSTELNAEARAGQT